MLKSILLSVLLLMSSQILALNTHSNDELLVEIQMEIDDFYQLIKTVSRENLAEVYFNKFKTYQIALSQLKANNIKQQFDIEKINNLSFDVESILDTSHKNSDSLTKKYNFRGSGNGVISGHVTSANLTEVNSVNIRLYDVNGNFIAHKFLDAFGRYIFRQLPDNQYTLIAFNSTGQFIDTAMPDITCEGGIGFGCELADLTFINISQGDVVDNADIIMQSHPTISGKIFDITDHNTPVPYPTITVLDSNGNQLVSANGNRFGGYSISIPQSGEVYVIVSHSFYITQLFENIDCLETCDINLGTQITINMNSRVDNFDFNLNHLPMMAGTLIDAQTSLPITTGSVYVYNSIGRMVETVNLDGSNSWEMQNIPVGTYKIISTSNDFLASMHESIACQSAFLLSCDLQLGSPINHPSVESQQLILNQQKGAKIKGTIIDENNEVISYARIYFFNSDYTLVSNRLTLANFNGEYQSYKLKNGDYYAIASRDGYNTELYPNVLCINNICPSDQAVLISITNTTDVIGIDFHLNKLGNITGVVYNEANNPIGNAKVKFRYSIGDNNFFSSISTNEFGVYNIRSLQTDSFQVYAYKDGYVSQTYDGIDCDDTFCETANYSPVNVGSDEISGIDFHLIKKGVVRFDLQSNSSNSINDGSIYVYNETNNYIDRFAYNSDISLDAGNYYFYYSSEKFVNKIYGGSNCTSQCNASTGTLVSISNRDDLVLTMNIDERFSVNFSIINSENGIVNLYDETSSILNVFNVGNNTTIHSGLTPFYFKIKKSGYTSYIHDGISCVEMDCDLTLGTLITPQLNSSMQINGELIEVASVTGKVTDTDGNPVSDAYVLMAENLNFSGANFTYTNDNGEYAFNNIPQGNYYIKVDFSQSALNQYLQTFYGNISCNNTSECEVLNIPTIPLQLGDYLTGIDIVLNNKGSISGEGIFDVNQQYVPAIIEFFKFTPPTSLSRIYRSTRVKEDGTIDPVFLFDGLYKMRVITSDNIRVSSAFPLQSCDDLSVNECVGLSQAIEVIDGQDSHFNQFLVHRAGRINGTISNRVTGEVINTSTLKLFKIGNGLNADEITITDTFSVDASAGEYKILTQAQSYFGHLYNNIDCYQGFGIDCLLSQGQTITIENDTDTTINFNLLKKPELKVSYSDLASDKLISSILDVYDANNNLVVHSTSSLDKLHLIENLQEGNYYLVARGLDIADFPAIGYPNIACETNAIETCSTGLLPVFLSNSSGLLEVNIGAFRNKGINGFVRDNVNQQILSGIVLDFWDTDGISVLRSTLSQANGGFTQELLPGSYYVTTDTNNQYANEVYKDVSCNQPAILGSCDITQGELIVLPENNTTPIVIDINLTIDAIYSDGFE